MKPHVWSFLLAAIATGSASAAVIGQQNFNGGPQLGLLGELQSPSLAATSAWATGDFWGPGTRNAWPQGNPPGMPFTLADDSVVDVSRNGTQAPFPADNLGIVDSTWGLNDGFFSATDTFNPVNSTPVYAEFQFAIAGFSDLKVAIDMAAMGDFEANDPTSPDGFRWTYSIDGAPFQSLIAVLPDESLAQNYTMEIGTAITLQDPLVAYAGPSATLLNDVLQTISADVTGSGAVLTLAVSGQIDGSEGYIFDNIQVTGVPEPSTWALLGLGLCGLLVARMRPRS